MRVLLLTQWFDPEPAAKGLAYVQQLRSRGHEVEVLTGFPNYPEGRLYPGWRQRAFSRTIVDGVTVTRVPLFPSRDDSARRRVATYCSFAATSALAALVVRRPDVVHVYHPPATTGLAALVLKHLRGVPFVLDVQDLWPDAFAGSAMVRGTLVARVTAVLLRRLYAAAEHIVTLSPGTTGIVAARSRRPLAVTTIANWTDESSRPPSSEAPRPSSDAPRSFTVAYAGNMGPLQDLDTVLDAAALLADRPEVRFLLVGDGLDAERLRRRVADEGLSSVEIRARVSPAEVGQLLRAADALLVHLVDHEAFRTTIPSKTQACLAAGRPIVMAVRGDAADLVREAGAGVTVAPSDPAALATAVRRLADLDPAELDAMGRAGQRHYDSELSLRRGVDRFEVVLERASRARPRVDAVKRLVDLVGASVGLVLGAPLLVAVGAGVALRLGRPVLFRQERPGRDGRPIRLVKFRTMTDERGADGALLDDTARSTRWGAFLRTASLDELPSLWNIVRGEMSFIGPRPLLTRYLPWYSDEERQRFRARPGLSGLAQVRGRNTLPWADRLALDVRYVRSPSLRAELHLTIATMLALVRRTGALADPRQHLADLDVERQEARS